MQKVFDKLGNEKQLLENNDIEFGEGYIKFSNGILICFGRVEAKAGEVEGMYTYAKTFISIPVTVAVHNWSNISRGQVTVGGRSRTQVNVEIYDNDNDISRDRHADLISIGRWK